MKKILFAIFAHPDDEAFGPSGALLQESLSGTDVHLMTLTLGEAGINSDNVPNLAKVREAEWCAAGAKMGARSMTALGYHDGTLSNEQMIDAQEKIIEYITRTIADVPAEAEIELMSIDPNGISGHIDHIVASRAAHFAFYRLKLRDDRFTRLRLACLPRSSAPTHNTNWLYMDAGRTEAEIDEMIDAREHHDAIIDIIRTHHSQRHDGDAHIKNRGDQLGLYYFMIRQ